MISAEAAIEQMNGLQIGNKFRNFEHKSRCMGMQVPAARPQDPFHCRPVMLQLPLSAARPASVSCRLSWLYLLELGL
jgi:hypothetical protein